VKELDRGLPASTESEAAILGGILLDGTLCDEVLAALKSEHFFLDSHRRIFNRICDLFETSRPIDTVTLLEELTKHKEVKAVGGLAYLSSLTDGVPRRASLKHYIDIVVEKFTLRQMIYAAEGIVSAAMDSAAKADEVVSNAEAAILNVAAEDEGEAVKIGDVCADVERRVAWGMSAKSERTALELTWGLSGLDSWTKGIYSGELTVLAGESGRGKTIFALQVTLANAREQTPVAWFSLEMPRDKLTQRLYPQMSDIICSHHMRDPRSMNDKEHIPEVMRMSAELQTLPIWVDDTSSLNIKKLVARIRMMRRKHEIRLFVIDYLQLIQPSQQDRGNGDGVKEVIFALRDLVKAEPIHILLLSQFSKADGFSKKRKRSRSDLYGGSVIHHAAQNVVLLQVEEAEGKEGYYLDAEFRIDKQRDGKVGKVECQFDPDHLLFTYRQQPLR